MKAQLVAIGFSSIGGQPQFFLLAFILPPSSLITHPLTQMVLTSDHAVRAFVRSSPRN